MNWYQQYKKAYIIEPSEPDPPQDPYFAANDMLVEELSGMFKIILDGQTYNVFWKGCSDRLRIVNHDIPFDIFRANREDIERKARIESQRYFKEAMKGMMGF